MGFLTTWMPVLVAPAAEPKDAVAQLPLSVSQIKMLGLMY